MNLDPCRIYDIATEHHHFLSLVNHRSREKKALRHSEVCEIAGYLDVSCG